MSAADIRRIALLKKWDAEMAQKAMTNTDKERADFEARAHRDALNLARNPVNEEQYRSIVAQAAFDYFRAGREAERDSMNELRKAVAQIMDIDEDTWPAHGNVTLAIAAVVRLLKREAERAENSVTSSDGRHHGAVDAHLYCAEGPYIKRTGAATDAEPVAYIHTLYMELGQKDEQLRFTKENSYGKPGKDYSKKYSVTCAPLYIRPPKPEPSPDVDYFATLVDRARAAATKAAAKFPQPNYVTLKIAEEAGEVVRGAVHYAEGRMPWKDVEGEIVQLLAMLIRFVTEGDQINGVVPPALTKPEGE